MQRPQAYAERSDVASRLVAPLFIIAAPRSGSTLLYELLAQTEELWTIGGESHAIIEGIPWLATAERGFHSDALSADDATAEAVAALHVAFLGELRDWQGRRLDALPREARPAAVRLLEKTPKNTLRVPFLAAAFPDARFIFLHRDAAENIASIIDAWQSGQFVSRAHLPGWPGPPWSLLLPPGWRALAARPLEEIAAVQWECANRLALDGLDQLAPDRFTAVQYGELLAAPLPTLERLLRFAGVRLSERLGAVARGSLPLSGSVLTAPAVGKWRRHQALVARVLPQLDATRARLASLPARAPSP